MISPEVLTIGWLSVFFDIPSERKAVSKYKLSECGDFSRKSSFLGSSQKSPMMARAILLGLFLLLARSNGDKYSENNARCLASQLDLVSFFFVPCPLGV